MYFFGPDASTNRRKMKLTGWKESSGWPIELSMKVSRKKTQEKEIKHERKIYTLAYRWGEKAEAYRQAAKFNEAFNQISEQLRY